MIKRLSKARRSAILQHLLALEKQIRAELGESPERRAKRHVSESDLRSQRSSPVETAESRVVSNEFTARSVH